MHQKHKRQTEKPALANKTNQALVWNVSCDLEPGNGAFPILTTPEPTHRDNQLILTTVHETTTRCT